MHVWYEYEKKRVFNGITSRTEQKRQLKWKKNDFDGTPMMLKRPDGFRDDDGDVGANT